MYGADILVEFPPGADVCGQVTRRECAAPRRWSMFTQSGVMAGQLAPVDRGVGPRDHRPRVRVRRRFAGEVPGIEFLEGGVDVVGVEHDAASRSVRRRRSR